MFYCTQVPNTRTAVVAAKIRRRPGDRKAVVRTCPTVAAHKLGRVPPPGWGLRVEDRRPFLYLAAPSLNPWSPLVPGPVQDRRLRHHEFRTHDVPVVPHCCLDHGSSAPPLRDAEGTGVGHARVVRPRRHTRRQAVLPRPPPGGVPRQPRRRVAQPRRPRLVWRPHRRHCRVLSAGPQPEAACRHHVRRDRAGSGAGLRSRPHGLFPGRR
jgi:hypothetical protein